MKKIIAFLLSAAMLVTFATACNKDSSEDDTLKIGITLFQPMNYYDDDNNLTGFETEFAKAVCDKLGMKAEFVEIDWDTKILELKSNKIDCIWNGMTVNDDLKENLSLSVSYMNNKQALITKAENADKYKDIANLDGITIVAEAGSAGEATFKSQDCFKNSKFVAVDSQTTALMEVAAGTADCALIDYVMSIGSIGEGTDYSDITIIDGATYAPEEYAIGFRKDDTELVDKVNKAIQELADDGTLNEIAEKYKLQDLILIK